MIRIQHKNFEYQLDYYHRATGSENILYLHGLGTSKEDFESAMGYKSLDKFNIISFDFPGCGQSNYYNEVALDINDLVDITDKVVKKTGLDTFHLIGHSMGGLTGLLYTKQHPRKVKSFINVEGNLDPIDCRVFSKYVDNYSQEKPEDDFFRDFKERLSGNPNMEFDVFLKHVKSKVKYYALRDYCQSIVKFCERLNLVEYFIQLDCDKAFIYGQENKDLPYLKILSAHGTVISEMTGSNHFPFYSNPDSFFESIGNFYQHQN